MELQSSAKTPTIPPEIWMRVAQFVPHPDLCSMLSINRVFFNLSMDARYHDLTFRTDSRNVEALRRLQRARSDPSIAHRVRSLCISLTYHAYGQDFFYPKFNEEGKTVPGADISTLEIMTETATCLTNITEFSVQWKHCPRGDLVVSFLIAAWKSFGSGLRKLSVDIPLEYLALLLSTVDGLLVLRDLNMTVNMLFPRKAEDDALATVLAPFVNKVAPALHSLSLCLSNLDGTPLFHNLETFPNLKQLRIVIRHLPTHLEPFRITHFICNHATTLRHLDWDQQYQTSDEHLTDLLRATNLDEVFLNLYTLRIRVPENPGGFALVARHITGSAQTLTSLGLLGYNMTYEEVNTLISAFAPRSGGNLKELSLRVQFLSPELILLLAQTLPHLEKLAIHMVHVTGHEAGKWTSEAIKADGYGEREQERLNAGIFTGTILTYDLRSWALRDITIRGASLDVYLPEKLMRLLVECVPSVQKVCGQDKEFYKCLGDTGEHL